MKARSVAKPPRPPPPPAASQPAPVPPTVFSPLWLAASAGLAVLAYLPALRAGFVWNDIDYVTSPGLRPWSGLARIWTEIGATEQYYPVLHSVFWLEHRLWGDSPAGYHVANLLLHLGAAWLFGLTLRRLGVKGAWFAASLFALHPVCVESVAWISEQKNTLSTVFFLAAALAYLRFHERRSLGGYVLATVLFLAALLSKSLTATLPPALLVMLWWRDERLEWRRHVRPLLPWFALGAAVGLFTAWVEHTVLGATGGDFELTWLQRLMLAGRIPWFYAGKLLWPAGQVFIYPRWTIDASAVWQYLFPLSLLAVIAVLWIKRQRGPLAAVLFFVGSLFPVLGFLSLYGFLFSYVADHWQYLPCLGLLALAGAGAHALAGSNARRARQWTLVAGFAALLACAGLSWRLAVPYDNPRSFYQTIIEKNPAAWMAYNNLGVQLMLASRPADASACYREALRLRPGYFDAENNLGQALDSMGDTAQAAAHYARAVQLNSSYAAAHANLGNALFTLGRTDEAAQAYRRALVLDPGAAPVHYSLGVIFAQRRRPHEALVCYQRALLLQPDYAEAQFNLASLLGELGRLNEAVVHYEAALQLQPTAGVHNNLGNALRALGRLDAAVAHFNAALALDPNLAAAHLNLALALQTLGRTAEAQFHAARARALGGRAPGP